MSDLISRSALLEEMYQKMSLMGASRNGQHPISMETVIDFIKDYPTAYDVDKVVEELEELHPENDCFEYEEDFKWAEKRHNKYIEIVKGGGVNE